MGWEHTAIFTIAALFLHSMSLVIYRICLSPIANVPGPKLAAATFWYEFYYDVIKQGRYTWKIKELHEQYGPIVRINPYEVHVNDPDYYNVIYAGPSKRREKWAWSAAMFGTSTSHFSTLQHELHRRRRAPLNPFFSRASVLRLEPVLREVVEHLCARLEGFRQTKQPVNLRHAFAAVTMDDVTDYAFGTSYKCLDDPGFAPMWPEAVDSVSEQSVSDKNDTFGAGLISGQHMNKQFPWLLPLMRLTPIWLVERMNPHVMRLIKLQIDLATQVSKHMDGQANDNKVSDHPTIFHELLKPGSLPAEERTIEHLVGEAQAVVAAGQVATTHYLNTTAYHIMAQPEILAQLKAELKSVMRDGGLPSLQKLEQLPLLSAIVLEGYRISYGSTHRLQRIAPDEALVYKSYALPAGTPMSMTSILIHENEELFPDPRSFKPERWIEPSAREKLSTYLNFSKGTRGCLGQHLAAAEIYLTLAAIFSRFDFELYKTTQEDIAVEHDFFNPQPRRGAVGLRAIVH